MIHCLLPYLWMLPVFGLNDSLVDPGLAELVRNIDKKTETITTIRAKFYQRRDLSLMTEPLEMRGDFYLKKPDGIKFEAQEKDDLILVITENEVVSLSPNAKKATHIQLKKRRDFLTQHLLSKKLEAMLAYFTIAKSAEPDEKGNHHLVLTPIKRKYKKKFDAIHLWVNSDNLIYRVHVHEPGGDVNRLELSEIEVNVAIDSGEFDTKIPEGYELGDRLSMLLGSDFGF